MKTIFTIFIFCFVFCFFLDAQTISGNFSQLPNQEIRLEGFNGLNTYPISKTVIDENGVFELSYSLNNNGVGYLISTSEKPLFVILSGEEIEIVGEALNYTETIKITKGQENQWFEQYAKEHPRREEALSAWIYLEKIYKLDSLFKVQKTPNQAIQIEKQRIRSEDSLFLTKLPKDSYLSWFLPTRKLVSSVSNVAQYQPENIPATISAFRTIDFTENRLYKSGLLKDAIESHFWLIENSGKTLDSVFVELKLSIDVLLKDLIKDEKILNEVTDFLFDLLERHSLSGASEYLALKVLNEVSCTIDSDLAKQLESYRAMKKGNIAPNINFVNSIYLNGTKQIIFKSLTNLTTPYTLVFFGASWCQKCLEETHQLIEKYVKWRNLGVEVVYISLDTEQEGFEKLLSSCPFFAYCDYKKWDSQVVQDYYVFSTPTFYLLNNKRELLLKPSSVSQLDAWVDWFLRSEDKN